MTPDRESDRGSGSLVSDEQRNGARARPYPQPRALICPYCGDAAQGPPQCANCKGLLDPLSRQASQNAMGPWAVRDDAFPFRPGFSYATLRAMVTRSRITRDSIVRGPPTRQFWTQARCTPGVAHLLGECHSCHMPARAADMGCAGCGASFVIDDDRQHLGLAPVQLLPGHTPADTIAASLLSAAGAAIAPKPPVPSAGLPAAIGETFEEGSRRRPGLASIVLGAISVLLAIGLLLVLFGPRIGLRLSWIDGILNRSESATSTQTGE